MLGDQKSRPSKRARVPGSHGLGVLDPALVADGLGHLMNASGVERRGEADRLGEHGRTADGDAVQGLTPPVVGRNAETRNRARVIDELRRLFFKRQVADQIGCTSRSR